MEQNHSRRGGISVETAHIFPIIKKWLYSEKDIFLRELVSNAADAVTKHRRLCSLGQIEEDEIPYRITVTVDKVARTLTISDNGIGMTEDELIRYLGNIALSGALEFIQKYEGEKSEGESNKNGIIGHFGLGFYSAFMVADTVEVITKSYTDAPALRWVCHADGSYELFDGERETRGTDVILHVTDEEAAYLEAFKIRDMLDKYCSFMPTDIYFEDADAQPEEPKEGEEPAAPTPINDTTPLWQKAPSECTDEEYKEFYHKVFRDYREPLFWIHINADYPLNFKGILYFPRPVNDYEPMEGQVKLYYNQVFVADNIKEVIPEYLLMLKGVLDCPELPLNVSRSYLQNNTYVTKVAAHIVKKVADKLVSLCDNDRETYEGIWKSVSAFVEYACMRDRKFYDRVKDALLLPLTDGTTVTVKEYGEAAKDTNANTVYYTSDKEAQAQYIALFEAKGIKVAVLDRLIDTQFAQMLEHYNAEVKYLRIDADTEILKGDGEAVENEAVTALFRKVSGREEMEVKYQALADATVPVMLTVSEESRRMEEMMKLYAMQGGGDMPDFPTAYNMTVNTSAALTTRLCELCDSDPVKAERMASYIWRLALLAQRKLTAEELKDFLSESYGLLSDL